MSGSPIGWVGGKSRLAREIVSRIPAHAAYVEPFAGGASVLFAKQREISRVEALNDAHGELTNLFRCMRDRPLELIEKLRWRIISREDFYRERELIGQESGHSEVERAAAFFWLLKCAFGSKTGRKASFGYSRKELSRFRSECVEAAIKRAHERLRDVYIFNEDFEKLIDRYDSADTFFYCDPPYWGTEKAYECRIGQADHERLAEALKRAKGKFLLSYNDVPAIRDLYGWAIIEEVSTCYSLAKQAKRRVTELLIRNYELPNQANGPKKR